MTSLNFEYIKKYQDELNESLFKKLNNSVLYADQQFMEWFHLTCGLDILIKKFAVTNIKEFELTKVKTYTYIYMNLRDREK